MKEFVRRAVTAAVHRGRRIQSVVLRRPSRAIWTCGLVGFGLAAAGGHRPPSVHDEFSYLLAGDTFARGRLANPTHPMWRHFETFHVIQQPTYASKYPPAQGLVIALGIRLAGSPALGVWISGALMIAALTWMLQAWVAPRWALWGGLAASLWLVGRHGFDGYWAATFWGGSVAALGGALVLGGVRRLDREPTIAASLAVGVGLAVLANSRPFEGIFFSLVPMLVVGWLTIGFLRRRKWHSALVAVAPMLAVLAITAGLMATYNKAVTGSVTEFPYMTYYRTYDSSPTILGQSVPAMPAYRVAEMERFYREGNGHARPPAGWRDFPRHRWGSSAAVRKYYTPLFVLPLIVVLPWVMRGFWARMLLASLGSTVFALCLTLFFWMPHYAAPAAGAIAILLVTGARYYAQIHRRGVRFGRALTRMIFGAIAISTALELTTAWLDRSDSNWTWDREKLRQQLAAGGRHFVLVEYGPKHDTNHEWVYNGADIDASQIIWARSLGPADDAAFIRYFAGRRGWRLRIDTEDGPLHLTPLTP